MADLFATLRFKLAVHQLEGLAGLARDVKRTPEILLCFEISGEFDLLMMVRSADMVDYNRFIDRLLAANPVIVRYETTFIKRQLKSAFAADGLGVETRTGGEGAAPEAPEAIWVNQDDGLVRLAAQDIERVTAEGDYMRIHIGPRSWLIHCTIKQLLEQLDPKRFIRLHRSAIVRRDFVGKLEHKPRQGWVACLLDGSRQRIAKSHVSEALSLANAISASRGRAPGHA